MMASISLTCSVIVCSVLVLGVTASQPGICRYGNASGCLYPCMCTSDCDNRTGSCGGECLLDYPVKANIRRTGKGCIIGNVALGKPANQSGQWRDSHAGLAVDGVITSNIKQCAHPSAGKGNRAWWYIDLQDSYTVMKVTIFNRGGDRAYPRTGDFKLGVGYSTDGDRTDMCNNYTGTVPKKGSSSIECTSTVTGRYVTIIRNKGSYDAEFLGLCEVMVHGYKPMGCANDTYGDFCGNRCNENCLQAQSTNYRSCYSSDGRCIDGCNEGYWGASCNKACNPNCEHTAGLEVCDRLNGTCTQGCVESHHGGHCQHPCRSGCRVLTGSNTCSRDTGACNHGCADDYFGNHCDQRCSMNCLRNNHSNARLCHISNGHCIYGCIQGYWGDMFCEKVCNVNCQGSDGSNVCSRHNGRCQKCVGHYFGDQCQHSCSSGCLISTGSDTCRRDTGSCKNGCVNGYHGNKCTIPCSQNCINETCIITDGICSNGCNGSYWGGKCDAMCNSNCLIKDSSEVCSQYNGSCSRGCQDTNYGELCQLECSINCHVVPGSNTCDRYTGDCNNGCKNGYYAEHCKLRCNDNCQVVSSNETCHRETGFCNNGCRGGSYGRKCEETCPKYCAELNGKPICEQRDGQCYQGCQDGWFGVSCEKGCEMGCRPLPATNKGACNLSNGICSHGCLDGLYGDYCNKTCNIRCIGDRSGRVCERYSGSCTCQIGYYGDTCEHDCSRHCMTVDGTQTCDKVNGMCFHGCQLAQHDTWYAGPYCNQSIVYVEFPENNPVNITEVTTDSIMIEWSHAEIIPLDSAAVFGYRITVIDERSNKSSQVKIREDNISMNHAHNLTSLSANTTYRIVINIYRQIGGSKTEDSRNSTKIYGTTLAILDPEPKLLTVGQHYYAAGLIIGVSVIAVMVAFLIIVIRRIKRHMKSNIEDEATIRSDVRRTEMQNENDMYNPSFENQLDDDTEHNTTYYDFPPIKSVRDVTCIKVDQLEVYIGAKKYTQDGLKKEYEDIEKGELKPCNVANKTENISKNRFKNIKAYDCTRVVLEANDDNDGSGYINASFITGYPKNEKHYVATQGPKPDTVRALWSMIWQLQSNRIVMLTQIKELAKTKCEQYWPEHVGEIKSYGDFTLTTSACHVYADYKMTNITLRKGDERRQIKHFQFLTWPDKQSPEHTFPLMAFRRKLRSFDKDGTAPIIVHCSAGVGRTGTLIALDFLMEQMYREGKVDVFKLVTQLRYERMDMVQTLQQYVFLYDCLLEAYQQGETAIPCNVYPERHQQLVCGNEYSNVVPVEEQFKILAKWKQHKESEEEPISLSIGNIRKNRDTDIVPDNKHRLFLSTICPGTNDYVNAVFVDSFLSQKTFVVTQLPLEDTVVDFWRLVYEHKCHTVVTIEASSSDGMDCPKYWAIEKDQGRKFGNLEVHLDLEEDEKDAIQERKFTLSFSSSFNNKSVIVRHILFKQWPDDLSIPGTEETLNLLKCIKKWQQQTRGGKIIIQCKDGARWSGMICAAHYMLEKMEADKEVDVFLAVKAVALHRHQFVNDLDQYCFLHDIAMEYIARNQICKHVM